MAVSDSAGALEPRLDVFSFAKRSLRLFAGTILLLAGGVLAWIGASDLQTERRFRDESRTARADIVGKALRPATSNSSTRYEVTYRVTLPDGAAVEHTEAVDVDTWETLEPGSAAVGVEYLPGPPFSVRLARDPEIESPAVMLGIGSALASSGFVLAAIAVRDIRRKLRLYRHGMPSDATVVAIEETNVRINKRPQWRIRFTYHDHFGQERRGASGYLRAGEAHAWRPGDLARVHFDRDQPDHVLWLGRPPSRP